MEKSTLILASRVFKLNFNDFVYSHIVALKSWISVNDVTEIGVTRYVVILNFNQSVMLHYKRVYHRSTQQNKHAALATTE